MIYFQLIALRIFINKIQLSSSIKNCEFTILHKLIIQISVAYRVELELGPKPEPGKIRHNIMQYFLDKD
jgi:hypothetical protein